MPLTREQKSALQSITDWLSSEQSQPSLTLGGYAGTGKTTVIAALRLLLAKQRPKWKVAFAAYTGKASQVLADKLKKVPVDMSKDFIGTLHSLMYEPLTGPNDMIVGWQRKNTFGYDLLVVDEASMVTQEIWRDIRMLGVPVLAVGDHGQLPPIDDRFDLMRQPDITLSEIHRQAEESPIIQVATLARERGSIPLGSYGAAVKKYDMQTSDAQILMEELYQSYRPDTLFLVGRNNSRVAINASVRAAHARGEYPEPGETVICLRNNWQKGIFNGMLGVVASARPEYTDGELISYDVEIEDSLGQRLYSGLVAAAQFNQPTTLDYGVKQREQVGELFDFGYALTVHKAQGSQARKVVVIEERSQHMDDDTWSRWLYTAVTRAEEELILFGQ